MQQSSIRPNNFPLFCLDFPNKTLNVKEHKVKVRINMLKIKLPLFLLFTLFFLVLVPDVYADDEGNFDLNAVPDALATRLNIDPFAAKILCSIILCSMFLFPALLLTRNILAHVIVGVAVLGFCTALFWFPVWLFVIICLLVALLFSDKITGIFGGKGD